MTPRLFADLHCHPGFYGFNRMRNHAAEEDPSLFHPWTRLPGNLRDMARGQRASTYAQSSVPQLLAGRCRLVFASFTPIEKGFFRRGPEAEDRSFWREAAGYLSGATPLRAGLDLVRGGRGRAAARLTAILRNRGPLRVLVQSLVMRYGLRRILHLISDDYDYWDELLREYRFFTARDAQYQEAAIDHVDEGQTVELSVAGAYHLVRDADHLTAIIEDKSPDLALVLTIEGGHVLTMGPDGNRLPEAVIFERIDALKALAHPVLFITLAHHFDNGVCGHAHSVMDAARLLMDQTARLHTGFEAESELGLRVARALLDLDDDLGDRGGRRVLIDVKHMSARARQEFYARIVTPYNARRERDSPGAALPVLFSHAAYAGVGTLDELIANAERENDHWHRPPYYAWNINLCDEDVRMVHATGGLIGLCFDQRICGVAPGQRVPDEHWPDVVARQIFGLVDVVLLDTRLSDEDKLRIWDCIGIGSDYDGFIDPLSRYPTVVSLPRFAEDLRAVLEAHKHTRLIARIGVDTLLDKLAWRNAYDFARRHLPAASR